MAAFYSNVDTTQKYRLGTRKTDRNNNTYIYLKGVGSTAAYNAVTFDEDYATALVDTDTAATLNGPLAVAQAAVDATTKYGWYGIYGEFTCSAGDVADNGFVYATSTAGRLDDAAASVGKVVGASWRSTDNSTANTATIQLNYPQIVNDLST